jgi:hypothetical protein
MNTQIRHLNGSTPCKMLFTTTTQLGTTATFQFRRDEVEATHHLLENPTEAPLTLAGLQPRTLRRRLKDMRVADLLSSGA